MSFPFPWGDRLIEDHEALVEALRQRARSGTLDNPGQLHPAQGAWALMRSTPASVEPIKAAAETLLAGSSDDDVLEFVLHLWQRPWISPVFHRTLLARLAAGDFSESSPGSHGTLRDDAVDRLADSGVIQDADLRRQALQIALQDCSWTIALVILRLSGQFDELVEVLAQVPGGELGASDAALIGMDLAEKAPALLADAGAALRGQTAEVRETFLREALDAASWMNEEDAVLLQSSLGLA